jgi:hypothetical protein
MALKGVVGKEIQKIRKTAATAALKLGFEPGKGRLDAVYLEYEWWTGQDLNLAQSARFRCLKALGIILDPLHMNGIGAIDWIREVGRSSAVLRRDVVNAASAPDDSTLQAFERAEREASANALRAACPIAA